MDLGTIIQDLYDSEINCCVSTFWDGGFTVKLGDELNGFDVEMNAKTAAEAAELLERAARSKYPDSAYALGKEEWERRNQARQDRHKNN